jgi:hypothetical protein
MTAIPFEKFDLSALTLGSTIPFTTPTGEVWKSYLFETQPMISVNTSECSLATKTLNTSVSPWKPPLLKVTMGGEFHQWTMSVASQASQLLNKPVHWAGQFKDEYFLAPLRIDATRPKIIYNGSICPPGILLTPRKNANVSFTIVLRGIVEIPVKTIVLFSLRELTATDQKCF